MGEQKQKQRVFERAAGRLSRRSHLGIERERPDGGAEQARIVDVDGNGIPTLVKMEGPVPGSFAREDGEFRSFRPFVQLPTAFAGRARASA